MNAINLSDFPLEALELSADDLDRVAGGATVHYVMPDHIVRVPRPTRRLDELDTLALSL